MESGKKEEVTKRQPFAFGIKELKRTLDQAGIPKKERNATIKMYKNKLYTRVDEVKAKMEKELLDASDK